jgi:hypothetical protein
VLKSTAVVYSIIRSVSVVLRLGLLVDAPYVPDRW